ncbi:MAG: class I SAM-dependent methyltransferase [Phycisphaerales bacterium]
MSEETAPPTIHMPTREGYDRWSEIYDSDGNPLVALEERVAPALLGDVRGLTVADIGCGTGRHALALAARGANVTAVDFSAGMLAAARAKAGAERVKWIEHDLAGRLPLESGAFDRVVCALVFDHIADVAGLMGELGRICKPHGSVLVTIMHPAMMLRGVQARFHDPKDGTRTMPASVPNQLSDYVMGVVRAGLTIDHMSEHAVDAELMRQCPRAEKHMGWPLLVVMRMRRK